MRDKCPLADEEFLYFIDMQRRIGKVERWGQYNFQYLYIDNYKYTVFDDGFERLKELIERMTV